MFIYSGEEWIYKYLAATSNLQGPSDSVSLMKTRLDSATSPMVTQSDKTRDINTKSNLTKD